MSNISGDGTLTPGEFRVAAFAFAVRWKSSVSAFPPWSWLSPPKHPWLSNEVDGYLALENVCLLDSSEENHAGRCTGLEDPNCSGDDEPIDDATLVQSCRDDFRYYDFHVIYDSSYRVPVLYFRAYSGDGRTLLLSEFEGDLPADSSEALVKSKWTFITQEEHPYLNRPWYKLHPCGTSECMKLLFQSDTSIRATSGAAELYLLSWFSVVGRMVGLSIPYQMMKCENDT
ncbi:ubiquitin-like-conjugating enzyme ATG10 isoform X2 [Rhodamnia argentea]|uniref:Ubiquitin-like-conjugating enzyme ATG10 n=1 Tax=Rhodamnia argentea TaxID=178133 RepID=A0A8B8MWN3_9MYRT|nr:ubiquitin-like-conjugating enzyme ATG10 isoform X2 [Rhodamnia argentea]